jgi:hypothetical protein
LRPSLSRRVHRRIPIEVKIVEREGLAFEPSATTVDDRDHLGSSIGPSSLAPNEGDLRIPPRVTSRA